ncbi:MAG: 5'-methylthioadenosine/S-adenosylhomocysteine nucleosidase [Leptospirales bacterium]|nr:5'-methylthioadenosine/S-adenosylhomocysteine nucleosidase [Leptospirales bacterium]
MASLLAVLKPDPASLKATPYGQYFSAPAGSIAGVSKPLIFFHGGWGKVDAAASAQWAISKWSPRLVVNIGTAGGFSGRIREGEIVFATRTIVYDIVERMGSAQEAIDDYTTELGPPPDSLKEMVHESPIISADQDIDPERIPELLLKYNAVAADWESASIARICKKNNVQVIILRGVSDVVNTSGSRTYGNLQDFETQSRHLMARLLALLSRVV